MHIFSICTTGRDTINYLTTEYYDQKMHDYDGAHEKMFIDCDKIVLYRIIISRIMTWC